MKKLFSFLGSRKSSDLCGCSSDTSVSLASSFSSLSTCRGYNLQDKHLKKLHKAASAGNVQKLKEYFQNKRTPLHLACANGCTDVVCLLIEKQCKINVQDHENKTPLIKAVECQQESCATILLHEHADPNLADFHRNTALHYAVCGQNVSLVKKLLACKANLEAKNKDGYTPLLLAIAENNEKMVKYLLKKGADVHALDNNQRTALMIALIIEPTNLVSLLLQKDVDLSCKDIYGFTAEDYASFNGFSMYHHLIDHYGKMKKVE